MLTVHFVCLQRAREGKGREEPKHGFERIDIFSSLSAVCLRRLRLTLFLFFFVISIFVLSLFFFSCRESEVENSVKIDVPVFDSIAVVEPNSEKIVGPKEYLFLDYFSNIDQTV